MTEGKSSKMGSLSMKKEREAVLAYMWSKPTPHELDVIDKGDHLKITSTSNSVTAWWLGTLRASYPQDQLGGTGNSIKMHPAAGVTLKLNREDGTLRIKGKHHWEWFKQNFEQVLERGSNEMAGIAEHTLELDKLLGFDEGQTLPELLSELPSCGGIKNGQTYIYRLWKFLLDDWFSKDGHVYISSPLLDAMRMRDILLLLIKHRCSRTQLKLCTQPKCDGESKYPRILKLARDMIKTYKGPKKKRLISDERLKGAVEAVDVKFALFNCKFIAVSFEEKTDMLISSASFHKWHFDFDSGDLCTLVQMSTDDFRQNYLEPLGLAHMVEHNPLPVHQGPPGYATL